MNQTNQDPYTSHSLIKGDTYTRLMLQEMFDIKDMTIKNGIFRPKGTNSIWLFVTEGTSLSMTYKNLLVGDELKMDGQTKGRTDKTVINHKADLNELVVFYRKRKNEFKKGGFKYEGLFEYDTHSGQNPTSFTLRRETAKTASEKTSSSSESADNFEPKSESEGRERTLGLIDRRKGQPAFRAKLIEAYEGRCALTGCSVKEILEAAHIIPYDGPKTNHVQNGLLLRADVHTLFDLYLLAINPKDFRVQISNKLVGSEYEYLNGQLIKVPNLNDFQPSQKALEIHYGKLIS